MKSRCCNHALDEEGQPTDDPPVSARRRSELVTPIPRPRKHRKKANPEQTAMDLHTDDTGLVVAVGIVGLQNAESIADRDPWRDNQKTARELPAGRRADRVDRLPRHQHGHDGRLARTGRHFHGEPDQLRVGLLVRSLDMFPIALVCLLVPSDLRQPDDRLHRFDLAEERTNALKIVIPPMS